MGAGQGADRAALDSRYRHAAELRQQPAQSRLRRRRDGALPHRAGAGRGRIRHHSRFARPRFHRLPRATAPLLRWFDQGAHDRDQGGGRIFRARHRPLRGFGADGRDGNRDPDPASHRAHAARHLCRSGDERAGAVGRDQARHGQDHPRRHLGVRLAGLHRALRSAGAGPADQPAQRLFRRHDRGHRTP